MQKYFFKKNYLTIHVIVQNVVIVVQVKKEKGSFDKYFHKYSVNYERFMWP